LESGAVVCQFTDAVQHQIDNFLSNGVVTASKIVRCIFLSRDQLLRVKELTVGSCANFINHRWFKINKDTTRHMLACTSFREECVESIITTTNGLVTWHLAIRLDAMLQTKQLPTGIANLDTALTNVDADDLTHGE